MAFIDDLNDAANSGWGSSAPVASTPQLSDEDQWLLYNYPGLSLPQARQAALIAAGLAPRATSGSSGGSSIDHFYDISPTDQFSMNANQRDYDYRVAQDAADAAWRQQQLDYQSGRDRVDDQFRRDQLAQQDRLAQQGYAIDQQRIAQQAAAAAADTAARLAGVQQQAQQAQLQYQVGMAGAANDAERNRIQAAWNQTQAQLAREEYALRDRLTTQQNQIAQYDAETKRAGTMGQRALDTNKFILEKSTSPRDLFGLFMMQRGVNPDWDRMAAGQDPGTIAPLVAQDPNAFQFNTPAVSFGPQAQQQNPQGQGPSPAPTQPSAPTPSSPLPQAPSSQQPNPSQPTQRPPRTHGGTGAPGAMPTPASFDFGGEADNYAYEMAADPIRNPQPLQRLIEEHRMAGGGITNDEYFMVGDNWRENPSAGGARPEMMWNPTRAPFFVAPNQQNMMEAQGVKNPATRPIGQVYDHMKRSDAAQGRVSAMGNDMYRQRMMADYGSGVSAGALRPGPMSTERVGWNPADMGPGYAANKSEPQLKPVQGYANAGLAIGDMRNSAPALQMRQPMFRRFALGTQEQYEATGNGSLYLPSSTNSGLNTADLPNRLKMLADQGMPLGPGLVASATGGTAPTLNLGNAVTQGRQAGVLPSLQTLGRQTKSETEHTRGYFEGVAGVPWADIVDYLGKQTDFLRSAQVARAA